MRKAGPIQEYLTAAHPLITLLQELLEHTESQEHPAKSRPQTGARDRGEGSSKLLE